MAASAECSPISADAGNAAEWLPTCVEGFGVLVAVGDPRSIVLSRTRSPRVSESDTDIVIM